MRERGGVRAKLIEKEEIRDLISKEKGIENEEREVVVKKKKKKKEKMKELRSSIYQPHHIHRNTICFFVNKAIFK